MLYQWIENTTGISQNAIIGIEGVILALLVFLVTVLAMKITLPILHKHKAEQPINDYLENHAKKAGTPTMGGVGFIIGMLIISLIWVILEVCGVMGEVNGKRLVVFAYVILLGVANALIGIVDDRAKLRREKNEGLTSKQKMILQIAVAVGFVALMATSGNLSTSFAIPFINYSLDFSYFAYPVYVLVIVGFVNSTNITDGLDGLATSIGAIVAVSLFAFCCVSSDRYDAVISASLLGALCGFYLFNKNPAKVFMGDTGSLFIGGIIVGLAVSTGCFIGVMIMGMVFILDMLSSLLQTVGYKLTKKRIFKRAPVHHHFEMLGWKEKKIVTVFDAVTLIFCILGFICCIYS